MKLKTSSSAAKRISKFSKKGKILGKKMSAQHRTKGKSKRALKDSMRDFEISKTNIRKLKKLLPNR